MRDNIDSTLSYGIGAAAAIHGWLNTNSASVMLYGGIIVLALRIYADGKRAWRIWKGKDNG